MTCAMCKAWWSRAVSFGDPGAGCHDFAAGTIPGAHAKARSTSSLSLVKLPAMPGVARWEKRKMSFTLIELLVVIAIVAILAALMLPALKKAKDTAKAAMCLSNLKQSGLSMMMYGNDFEGNIPVQSADINVDLGADGVVGGWLGWTAYLHGSGYINARSKAYRCPSRQPYDWKESDLEKWTKYSYGMDPHGRNPGTTMEQEYPMLTYNPQPGRHMQYRKTGRIRNPAKYFMLIDSATSHATSHQLQAAYVHWYGGSDQSWDCYGIHMRHNRRANGFFWDGHAASMGLDVVRDHGFTAVFLGEGDGQLTKTPL